MCYLIILSSLRLAGKWGPGFSWNFLSVFRVREISYDNINKEKTKIRKQSQRRQRTTEAKTKSKDRAQKTKHKETIFFNFRPCSNTFASLIPPLIWRAQRTRRTHTKTTTEDIARQGRHTASKFAEKQMDHLCFSYSLILWKYGLFRLCSWHHLL